MEEKKPFGRPSEYNPEWVEIVPEMFRDGQSITEVAVELGISKSMLYRYMDDHEDFRDAISRGRELSQAWWERQARDGLYKIKEYDSETKVSTEKSLNDRLWMNNVRFRFPDDYMEKNVENNNQNKSTLNINMKITSDDSNVEMNIPDDRAQS